MHLIRVKPGFLGATPAHGRAHVCCWVPPFLKQMRESCCIHSPGGLGLAAIQIARAAGAKVLATAGSTEKRAHLRKQGVPDVLSSRDLHFAEHLGGGLKGHTQHCPQFPDISRCAV